MQSVESHKTAPQPANLQTRRPRLSALAIVLSWMLPLLVLLIPIRALVMGYGWYWLRSPIQQGGMVLAGTYLDLLYVLGLGVVFWALLKYTPGRFLRGIILALLIAVSVFSLLLALVNISVVPMIGQPLTYPWLYYSGFLRSYDAHQAIAAGLSWSIVIAACAYILLLVLLALGLQRLARFFTLAGRWRYWAVASLLLIGYVPLSIHALRGFYYPTLQNPVVALVGSMLSNANVGLFSDPTSAGTEDFRTVAERAEALAQAPSQQYGIHNVIIVVMESVAAQYLPAYGGRYPVTPELDSYRSRAKLYRNIYAHAPSTNKSIVSLLCSMYPWPTYRFLTQEFPNANVISLSDVLSAQGYRTAFFSAADLRFGSAEQFLEHHQFDLLRDYRSIGDGHASFSSTEGNHLDGMEDAAVVRSLMQWVQKEPQKPFFAMFWTNQTHYPYFPTPGTSPIEATGPGAKLLGRYLAGLRDSDKAIGEMLRDIERLGIADSTLVVVVGDHGEAFGQHGRFGHGNRVQEASSMGGNFGHGSDLYEENIHVPMFLINPRAFRGEEDSTVGGLVDIAPTILDFLHLPLPGNWQGRSLMRPVERQRVYFTAPWSGSLFGYREGDRKYLFDAIRNSYRVFDLKRDPAEAANLAGELPDAQLHEVYQQLAAWVQYQNRLVRKVAEPGTESSGIAPAQQTRP